MKHKIIVITASTTLCTCLIATFVLMQLGLTTETNMKWYEFTLSSLTTISSYILAWYLGYTHYMKTKKDKSENLKAEFIKAQTELMKKRANNGKPQQNK